MAKPSEGSPWDRREWPQSGEASREAVYTAVGQALTHWERYEVALAILFGAFVSPFNSYAARRAYVAVRTFEGRAEMLRAASAAYFEQLPNSVLQDEFRDIIRNAKCFSQRRNDVAHGVVDVFVPATQRMEKAIFAKDAGDSFALYPSVASFKDRDLGGVPSYCMIVPDIDYFAQQFENLIDPAIRLKDNLGSIWNTEIASRYRQIERDQP